MQANTYNSKDWKKRLIEFLSPYWHLIDTFDIKTLYEARPLDDLSFCSSALTEYLLECGINPLDYMDYIPKYYLESDAHLPTIIIPNHIEGVESDAFFYCTSIETIRLNWGCKYIRSGAFQLCSNLKAIYIPSTVFAISPNAFIDCEDCLTIYAPAHSYAILYASDLNINHHIMTPEECIKFWGKVD